MSGKNGQDLGSGFFIQDEWVRFCAEIWTLTPRRLNLHDDGKPCPRLECVTYRNRRGRLTSPTVHPYLGLRFVTTETSDPIRCSAQWQKVLGLLADALETERGNWLCLPPGVVDVRELRWRNYVTDVRYTYQLALPLNLEACDPSVRKNIHKAEKNGYYGDRLGREHIGEMTRILKGTENKGGFSLGLDYAAALDKGLSGMGADAFRCYGAWTPDRRLAAVRVVLFRPGLTALDWLASTDQADQASGVTQLLIRHVLSDLAREGCTDFDFCGANRRSIGAAKALWGGRLVPFYAFRKRDLAYAADVVRAVAPAYLWTRMFRGARGGSRSEKNGV